MEKRYLDLTGLQDVASHVNTRLKTVTTIPVSADDGAVRLYVGETNVNYTKGHIYQYDLTNTRWNDITGSGGGGADNVVEGYFNSTDNLFYEESTYVTPIVGANNTLYVSLDTNLLYRYNNSIFIRVDEVVISGKADKVSGATNGDLASLDSNGNLSDSGIASTNVVIKSSTAGLIKNDGTIDTNTYLTENDIADKADKVTSATNGDLAGLDANGNLTDSGILTSNVIVKSVTAGLVKNDGTIDTNTYLTDADIADKADIVDNATNGDLAGLDANGNLTDSGVLANDVLVKSNTAGLVKNDGTIDTNTYATTTQLAEKTDKVANAINGHLAGLDSNGNLTDSGVVADKVIEKVSTATGLLRDDGTVDTSTYATTAQLAGKADKVASATADDFATLDANGNLTDSGINKNIIPNTATSSNKLATNNDLPTELNDLSDDVEITNPVNAQVLTYNSTSGKWENQTGSAPIGGTTFKGSILFANIPTTGMDNGDWYDIKDAFTTDSRFEEGAGIECTAGTDIIWVASDSKWNILTPSGVNSFNGRVGAVVPASGDYDASDIDYDNTTSGLTATDVQDAIDEINTNVSGKADKVTNATNGHLANLNSSGNLTDSGVASDDVIVKSSTAGLIKNDGTIDTNTYLTENDITDKADKVDSATNGDLAGLDSNGNLTDSGILATDVITKQSTGGVLMNNGSVRGLANYPLKNSDYVLVSGGMYEEFSNLFDDLGRMGAMNYLDANPTSTTVSGVTFTVNADKSIKVNGTATDDIDFEVASMTKLQEALSKDGDSLWGVGKWLRGCPANGSSSTYCLYYDDDRGNREDDTGEGAQLGTQSVTVTPLYLHIGNGTTVNNLMFYPMILDYTSQEYLREYFPYAKNNRDLTSDINGKADLTDLADAFSESIAYSIGNYVTYDGDLYRFRLNKTAGAWDNTKVVQITVGGEFVTKANLTDLADEFSTGTVYGIGKYITYNGHLYRFTAVHLYGDEWDESKVVRVAVLNDLQQARQDITEKQNLTSFASTDFLVQELLIQDHLPQENVSLKRADSVSAGGSGVVSADQVSTALNKTANPEMIAPTFSSSQPYSAGDYVTKLDGVIGAKVKLFQFTANHTGAWTGEDVREVEVTTVLNNKVDKVSGKGLSTNDYDNTAKGIVDNIQDNVKANTQLISESIWGENGKNELPCRDINTTTNGITFITNDDGSITANGTATAEIWITLNLDYSPKSGDYILNGCPVDGENNKYLLEIVVRNANDDADEAIYKDFGNGVNVNIPADGRRCPSFIVIRNGQTVSNLVFKPMFRNASILDDTYEPYHNSIITNINANTNLISESIWGENGKQLIPFPYRDISTETNGVTVTVNADGSITLNGTYTGSSYYSFGIFGNNTDICKNFIAKNGGKEVIATLESNKNVTAGKVRLYGNKLKSDNSNVIIEPNGSSKFTLISSEPSSGGGIYLTIESSANGYNFDNVTLYPMIRFADILDGSFEPYHNSVKDTLRDEWVINSKNKLNIQKVVVNPAGITPVLNDGIINLMGTATADAYVTMTESNIKNEYAGMILSDGGLIPTSLNNKVNIRVRIETDEGVFVRADVVPTNGEMTIPTLESGQKYRIDILVKSGADMDSGVIIKPMIRLATEIDPAYEPYHTDLKGTLRDAEIVKGKNFLDNILISATDRTVTAITNSDKSVTINGTPTSGTVAWFKIAEFPANSLPAGKYILSGCPSGGSGQTYKLMIREDPINTWQRDDYGNGNTFDLTDTTKKYVSYIGVYGATTNVVFKPMLRLASETDPSYEPYYTPLKDSMFPRSEQEVLGSANMAKQPIEISKTVNGVTFVNTNGVIVANNQATADANFGWDIGHLPIGKYKFVGCPADGSATKYCLRLGIGDTASDWGTYVNADYGDGFIFEVTNESKFYSICCRVFNGHTASNITFKPMITPNLDATYSDYISYAMTNKKITTDMFPREEQRVLGAKNFIPYPYRDTTKTTNGITFTDNQDGTITANGTATADAYYTLQTGFDGNKFNGNILSGCPSGGGNTTYHVYLCITVDPFTHYADDYGNGAYINCPSTVNCQIVIRIRSGQTVSNLVFKPMIRLASDADNTYVPYAMTNKQLTDKVVSLDTYLENSSVTLSTSDTTTVTFTSALITANSVIDYACTVWDLVPDDITATTGSCTITLPKVDSAMTVGVRIYIR